MAASHEEQTFKSPEAFVSSDPLVGVIWTRLSCQKRMLSRLELQAFRNEIDVNRTPSVQDMQT